MEEGERNKERRGEVKKAGGRGIRDVKVEDT